MLNKVRHKLARPLVVLIAAMPLIFGLVASGMAAPCAHHGSNPPAHSDCPCCDRMAFTGAASCGLACYAGVEIDVRAQHPLPDVRRISFAQLDERAEGLAIAPPLPPPR